MSSKNNYKGIHKIVLLGDATVGKTSLLYSYSTSGKFTDSYKATVGLDLYRHVLKVDNDNIFLQFWDLSGQTVYKESRANFYNRASAGLLIYDISNRKSFESIDKWVFEFRSTVGDIPVFVIGNKIDLDNQREVSFDEADKKVKTLNGNTYGVFETTAKDHITIKKAISRLVEVLLESEL